MASLQICETVVAIRLAGLVLRFLPAVTAAFCDQFGCAMY